MIALLAFAAALNATPTPPGGFTPSDLAAAAARDNPDAATERALAVETERLRLAIAYDPARAIAARSPTEQDLLIGTLGTGAGAGDLRARWFMAGAIQQRGSGSWTFLYHPLARGWLALEWARDDAGAWRVARMRVASSGLIGWTAERDRPWLAALVADYAAEHEHMGAAHGDLAGMEADRWITGAALWLRDPAKRAAVEEARRLIAGGRAARLGGGAIDALPARARATFWPVAGLDRTAGRSLIFGSALFPQILIAADYDDAARPALQRLTLVNLANAGAAR